MKTKEKEGFTLVELLVVIGIIALLIAILMPALSRARKQALQVSCGSNERQLTYASIAYGNDWQQMLPTRMDWPPGISNMQRFLAGTGRLPIVGFDTVTIWHMSDFQVCCCAGGGIGGWGFMMRDYMKNDFDVAYCPDGWWSAGQLKKKYGGIGSCWGAPNIGGTLFRDDTFSNTGYLWLPHRDSETTYVDVDGQICLTSVGGGYTPTDNHQAVARTASGKPDLLILADYIQTHAQWAGGYQDFACLAANHGGSDFKGTSRGDSCADWVPFRPDLDEANNPDIMPLGSNSARIDCRTTWKSWQDIVRPGVITTCSKQTTNWGFSW